MIDLKRQRRTVSKGLCGVFFFAALLLAGCGPSPRVEPGLYRAVLTTQGGELPFGMQIAAEGDGTVAYLINGRDRVRIPDVQLKGKSLTMDFPGFGNQLDAKLDKGKLQGTIVLVKSGGREQVIPLTLQSGASYRFFEKPDTAAPNVAGRWTVTFTEADGTKTPAVGEFEQNAQEVTGTFLTTTGDHRFLAGEVHGRELFLSTFDGAHAYLYRAQLTPEGQLKGKFWSGTSDPDSWVARRDEKAELPDANKITTVKDATWSFGFTFPDLEGAPVSLADKQFRGKVVIVALSGSWCPNCHDEAAFLAPFYVQNRERGLEVVSLMFERFGEFDRAVKAVKGFRRKFDIQYPTLIAGISDKDDAARKLPLLSGVDAFPTMVFVDRHGRVRRIHSGFSGPATGEHYRDFQKDFTSFVGTLLAEQP